MSSEAKLIPGLEREERKPLLERDETMVSRVSLSVDETFLSRFALGSLAGTHPFSHLLRGIVPTLAAIPNDQESGQAGGRDGVNE
ncbi:uncharacterized protein G2W53_028734 [Senna tora]|uniref:Uncharacterized protein n=1 Tax=Senna tora TaxID=362788 RepID=A0A834T3A0_9FABA|nr:uncharacterized protein G2W53_028734 [Senna tora]